MATPSLPPIIVQKLASGYSLLDAFFRISNSWLDLDSLDKTFDSINHACFGPRGWDLHDLAQALPVNSYLPRGIDTGGSILEQTRKIVSGPLPERDGTG